MAGTRIRWGSAVRAAAIAAAVVAAIISLPALIGNDRPPPVPDDVGLVPPPGAATPAESTPIQSGPEPLGPEPSPAMAPAGRRRRSHGRPHEPRHRHEHRSENQRRREDTSVDQVPPTPVYLPSSAPLPDRGEFTIESP